MARIQVYRYDPDGEGEAHYDAWDLDVKPGQTVLDLLHVIHYYHDPTLSFRRSCQAALCGSCGMTLNGRSGLSCNTQAAPLIARDGYLLVDPMKNLPVLKDLVVDMEPFWNAVYAIDPYLRPGAEPHGPYVVPKKQMDPLKIAQDCIMCGSCLSECTSREANPEYLGPAALAKAYRFVADARDGAEQERLERYSEPNGIWDCDTCLYCNEVCPMHVKPMDAIMRMREKSIELGIPSQGATHALAFYETIVKGGKLNEFQTVNNSLGIGGMVSQSSIAAKVLLRGKRPSIRKKPIEGFEDVQKIMRAVERKKRREARR